MKFPLTLFLCLLMSVPIHAVESIDILDATQGGIIALGSKRGTIRIETIGTTTFPSLSELQQNLDLFNGDSVLHSRSDRRGGNNIRYTFPRISTGDGSGSRTRFTWNVANPTRYEQLAFAWAMQSPMTVVTFIPNLLTRVSTYVDVTPINPIRHAPVDPPPMQQVLDPSPYVQSTFNPVRVIPIEDTTSILPDMNGNIQGEHADYLSTIIGITPPRVRIMRAMAGWASEVAQMHGMTDHVPTLGEVYRVAVTRAQASRERLEQQSTTDPILEEDETIHLFGGLDPRSPNSIEQAQSSPHGRRPFGRATRARDSDADSDVQADDEYVLGTPPQRAVWVPCTPPSSRPRTCARLDDRLADVAPPPTTSNAIPAWFNLLQGHASRNGGLTHSFAYNMVIQMIVHAHHPESCPPGIMDSGVSIGQVLEALPIIFASIPNGEALLAALQAMVNSVSEHQVAQLLNTQECGFAVGDGISMLANYLPAHVQEHLMELWHLEVEFSTWQFEVAQYLAAHGHAQPDQPAMTHQQTHISNQIQFGLESSDPPHVWNAIQLAIEHGIVPVPSRTEALDDDEAVWPRVLDFDNRDCVDSFLESIGYLVRVTAWACWGANMVPALQRTFQHLAQTLTIDYSNLDIRVQHQRTDISYSSVTITGPGAYQLAVRLEQDFPNSDVNAIPRHGHSHLIRAQGFRGIQLLTIDPLWVQWMQQLRQLVATSTMYVLMNRGQERVHYENLATDRRVRAAYEASRRGATFATAGRGRGRGRGFVAPRARGLSPQRRNQQ